MCAHSSAALTCRAQQTASGFASSDVLHMRRRLQSVLTDASREFSPRALLDRGAQTLRLGDSTARVVELAARLLELAQRDWLAEGRRPAMVCAAALLTALRALAVRRSAEDVAAALGVSASAMRPRLRELQQSLCSLAQQLPWGQGITPDTVMLHVRFITEHMAMLVAARDLRLRRATAEVTVAATAQATTLAVAEATAAAVAVTAEATATAVAVAAAAAPAAAAEATVTAVAVAAAAATEAPPAAAASALPAPEAAAAAAVREVTGPAPAPPLPPPAGSVTIIRIPAARPAAGTAAAARGRGALRARPLPPSRCDCDALLRALEAGRLTAQQLAGLPPSMVRQEGKRRRQAGADEVRDAVERDVVQAAARKRQRVECDVATDCSSSSSSGSEGCTDAIRIGGCSGRSSASGCAGDSDDRDDHSLP